MSKTKNSSQVKSTGKGLSATERARLSRIGKRPLQILVPPEVDHVMQRCKEARGIRTDKDYIFQLIEEDQKRRLANLFRNRTRDATEEDLA